MTFKDWLFSNHPEGDSYSGQWQFPHIFTLCLSIAIILTLTFLFKNKNEKTRSSVVRILSACILFFELARRIINITKGEIVDFHSFLYVLVPRPWCAISCWLLIISGIFNKKSLWNFSAINALLCAVIFFAYPSAGFNDKHILFENLYSITTHALLLITSITILTLKIGDFRYKRETFKDGFMKELIMLAVIFVYAVVELLLDLSSDPLYFMPIEGNEVKEILGLGSVAYVILYTVFLCVWINAFYLIPMLKNKLSKKK
ncbi:MAG: hypothetical protein IJA97_06595 [Clostridia bacterium]|nr:hypothetical protein [Clostridia bacterium]